MNNWNKKFGQIEHFIVIVLVEVFIENYPLLLDNQSLIEVDETKTAFCVCSCPDIVTIQVQVQSLKLKVKSQKLKGLRVTLFCSVVLLKIQFQISILDCDKVESNSSSQTIFPRLWKLNLG